MEKNIQIVVSLSERGIINSIASKNDKGLAMQEISKMQTHGSVYKTIAEYFVFPIINWQPKGSNVKLIIEKCQLRATNVLFVDDNPSNLKEVEYYNPGINVMHVDDFSRLNLSAIPQFKGKNDLELIRLKQYKLLERKDIEREHFSDNESFLRESEIEIIIHHIISNLKERVLELINRTNQLNFTKIRIEDNQLEELLANHEIECCAIEVHDKFGDYGICGFYALDKHQNKLLHYLFSCRILNLGVEEYVYQMLGKPSIELVEPVSSQLLKEERIVDWIKIGNNRKVGETDKRKKVKVLLIGGCDLS